MTWNPYYQPYRTWRKKQISKVNESGERIKGKSCEEFQARQNIMDNISDDEKSEESNQTDNDPLKIDPRDCEKEESQGTQRSTMQPLRKASLIDVLLQKIQPSLSKREWIINQRQRHVYYEKPKIYAAKDLSGWESKPHEFERAGAYRDERKWRKEKRDISESRIKRSMETNDFDMNDDNRKMRKRQKEMSRKKIKLMEKKKCKQMYKEEPKPRHSIRSFDSEVYLEGLTLTE